MASRGIDEDDHGDWRGQDLRYDLTGRIDEASRSANLQKDGLRVLIGRPLNATIDVFSRNGIDSAIHQYANHVCPGG
jgi:hypothetical protein